jgi:phospholipid-binding lipoprotein MlaA
LNRATFSLNEGLDKIILKPIAKGYRTLPSPIRTSTSNVLDNLSNLITIPNNVLQGELGKAGINTEDYLLIVRLEF